MAKPPTEAARPSEAVVARQNALFDWHRQWTARRIGRSRFEPSGWPASNSVYNLHSLDVEASAPALDEFDEEALAITARHPDR